LEKKTQNTVDKKTKFRTNHHKLYRLGQ